MTPNFLASTCLASLALATSGQAQTIQLFDGTFGAVVEATSPASPCAYPNGPLVGGFPSGGPFGCTTAGPVSPLFPIGGIAVNKVTDTVWATDEAVSRLRETVKVA